MKTLFALATISAIFAASPVIAEDKMMKDETGTMGKIDCTDFEMMKMNSQIEGMSSADSKKMAMDQMTMAKDSMVKGDMKGCEMHMNEAQGVMKK